MEHHTHKQSSRGEVASLLTIVSMVAISVGLLIGYRLTANQQASIGLAPQAQAPTRSAQPENHHNICYIEEGGVVRVPGVGEMDPLCEMNFIPETISIVRGKPTVNRATSRNTDQNPSVLTNQTRIIDTPNGSERNFTIAGALCTKSNVNFDPADIGNMNIFASAVAADPQNPTTISTQVKRYVIRGAAGDIREPGSENVYLMDERLDVCTFDFDSSAPIRNETNPIGFDLYFTKATLLTQVERAVSDGLWNAKECSIYIHADTNTGDSIDVYNITKFDLRKLLTKDEIDLYCPSTTVTPTVPVDEPTVTPTETPTPTVPTLTPTPTTQLQAACFERCNVTTTCGNDPVTAKPMKCYSFTEDDIILPPPGGATPPSGNEPNSGNQPDSTREIDDTPVVGRIGSIHGLCGPDSPQCVCLPDKCAAGEPCETKPQACEPLSTETPPPPSITELPQACEYKALAYVQECKPENIDAMGRCARDTRSRFIAEGLSADIVTQWGASNNKQIAGGRYGDSPANTFDVAEGRFPGEIDEIKADFPIFARQFSLPFNKIIYKSSVTFAPGADPLKEGSLADLSTTGRAANPILIDPSGDIPTEQYYNFEDASVRLIFDNDQYRVVPEGNEIVSCENDLRGSSIGACDYVKYNERKLDLSVDPSVRDPRDTIAGLTVGCGQNITYGWTVQKCVNNFDYLFVIDVSTSMSTTRDLSGRLKIDEAKSQLTEMLAGIQSSGSDSRVGIVQYSHPTNTRVVHELSGDIDSAIQAVNNNLTVLEGTCHECGVKQAHEYLARRTDVSRPPVVIFLTDGVPTRDYSGNPHVLPVNDSDPDVARDNIMKEAEILKKIDENMLVLGIGYGDPAKASTGVPEDVAQAQMIRYVSYIASGEEWLYATEADVSLGDVLNAINSELNSCAQSVKNYSAFLKTMDINVDGVINTIDLFLIYDNYFARGQNLGEDLNSDNVVNSLDVSIIVNHIGTIIPEETNTAQKSIGDIFN